METHPCYGPGNGVVDSCARCRLIWLDYGELKKVRDAPGRDLIHRLINAGDTEPGHHLGPSGRRHGHGLRAGGAVLRSTEGQGVYSTRFRCAKGQD